MNGIHDIADFIVAYSVDNKIDLTHKKLQKLLYYAHGFYLVIEKKPLFDAKLEAWKYGPVNKAVWDSFKSHGYLSITKPKNLGYRSLEGGIKNYLALFLYSFISISQDTLIDMSHTDAVWDLNYIPGLNKEISSEEMGLYFGEFKDFIEYRSFADQKVNFLKLIKARIDYFFALEDIGNGWDSSGSPVLINRVLRADGGIKSVRKLEKEPETNVCMKNTICDIWICIVSIDGF